MLGRARREVPNSMLVRNDGSALPIKSECIDAVLLFAVLTCIPLSNDQRVVLAKIERVLRPGGLLYISDVLVNNDLRNRERYAQYAEKYQCYGVFELPEGVVVRHHEKEWIEELTGPFRQLASGLRYGLRDENPRNRWSRRRCRHVGRTRSRFPNKSCCRDQRRPRE